MAMRHISSAGILGSDGARNHHVTETKNKATMAGGPEAQTVRLLPVSPVYGRLIDQIRTLNGGSKKKRKTAGDRAVMKLMDLVSCLATLQEELAVIEQGAAVAADDAPQVLVIRDAAYLLLDILDDLEYARLRSSLGVGSEVRPQAWLPSSSSSSLVLGLLAAGVRGYKHGADWMRLLQDFAATVTESSQLIARLRLRLGVVKGKNNLNPNRNQHIIVAATVAPELAVAVLGRKDEQDKIVRLLIQSSCRPSVISVVGMCGVGKTTLAQLVYNDTRVEQHFDLRIWVSVPGASMSRTDITREILQSTNPVCADKMAKADLPMLQSELSRLVASHRFLLVIDELLSGGGGGNSSCKEVWADILAPLRSAEKGSSVLVTTPAMMVAEMLATSQPYVLKTLDKTQCSALFLERALSVRSLQQTCPELLEHIAKGVADKLQGLPLAAKVLGGVLGATSRAEEWRTILDTRIGGGGDAALGCVQLSYDCLPGQLKECFAYCALFPKSWKFDRSKLICLWMAEGFLVPQQGKRMEDIGSEYFDALVSLSFFQRCRQGSKTYYMMHHWFHDLAEAVSANVCFRIEPGFTATIPPTVRHLSVTTDSLLDLSTCCSMLQHLRTLLVLRSPWSSLQDYQLRKLRNLRVLDLSGSCVAELPDAIGDLVHLRYLSLCGTLSRLPESLGQLLHLQALCFPEECHLDKLPSGTTKLINLRYLDIDTKYIGKLVGIRRMVNLQGSVELHVAKGEGRVLQYLRDIKGLRGQIKITGLDNVSTKEEASKAELDNKQYLNVLELEWNFASRIRCQNDAQVLENLRPHSNLRELSIRRYSGFTAPSWLQSRLLKELQSLHLINCRNLSMLPPLGQLPTLQNLHMKELCAVDQIGAEFYSSDCVPFPSLKVLELIDFPRLLEWSAEGNGYSFPCLKTLRLVDCPKLKQIPSLPAIASDITVERICSVKHLRLAPFSSNSVMLTLDACTTTVICERRLFHRRHLECIKILNINGSKQFSTSEGLGSLLSLQKLQLRQSDMTDDNLSLFLKALPSLSSLEMTDLPNITTFPLQADFSFCSALTELHITNCPLLCSLPFLQAFVALKHLVIERCPRITASSFPINFGSLVSLKILSILYCSQFQSLPALPSSLEALNLIGCHLKLIEQSKNKIDDLWKKITTVPKILIR